MGFGSASGSLVWTASPLSVRDVKNIMETLFKKDSYRVDVDMSWIIRKLGVGLTQHAQIKKATQFLRTLARDGFIVTPVCDNTLRHHSKRDSINRYFKREKARVDGLLARCKLIALVAKTRGKGGDLSETSKKEKNKLNDICKKMDSSSFVHIPDNFPELIQNELDVWNASEVNVNGGMVCKVKTAAFQADTLMAYRFLNNESRLIIGNDTDFAALIGKDAFVIRNFKFGRERCTKHIESMKLHSIEIGGASNVMMNKIKKNSVKNLQ